MAWGVGRLKAKAGPAHVKVAAWTRGPARAKRAGVETRAALELRTIVPSERDAVLDLLAHWLEDREFFARYFRHDPSFRDDLCLVAVDRGAIVSTVQVFRRVVRLEAGVVQVAAVGNVFTAAAYRDRGLATALLNMALAAMPAHGFDMSLLFATRLAFYGRLGWQSHVRQLVFLEPQLGTAAGAYAVGPFRPDDLDAVARVYDEYTAPRIGPTVRSPAYWRGQLHFAGNPSEDFLVARDGGQVVAYARGISLYGLYVVMEHACARGHDGALGQLVATLHTTAGASFPGTLCQLVGETGILSDLGTRGIPHRVVDDVFWLWRVLDAERVATASGLAPAAILDDQGLFRLLPPGRSVYWVSDRF